MYIAQLLILPTRPAKGHFKPYKHTLTHTHTHTHTHREMDQIEIPVCFFNALDDQIVPVELQEIPKEVVKKSKNAMHVTTKFGGHLGFYEGE